MAKRKNQLADKLSTPPSPPSSAPGWRDILRPQEGEASPEPVETEAPLPAVSRESQRRDNPASSGKRRRQPALQQPQKFARKTYLISPRMIQRINFLAEEEAVGINELVRYMLNFALDEIEAGRHELPTRPSRRTIDG